MLGSNNSILNSQSNEKLSYLSNNITMNKSQSLNTLDTTSQNNLTKLSKLKGENVSVALRTSKNVKNDLFSLETQEYQNQQYKGRQYNLSIMIPQLKGLESLSEKDSLFLKYKFQKTPQEIEKSKIPQPPSIQPIHLKKSPSQLNEDISIKGREHKISKQNGDSVLLSQLMMYDSELQKSRIKSENENLEEILKQMQEEKKNKEYKSKTKIQLARDLILANNDSPLAFRINNQITMGKNCNVYLKLSKFQDFDFYEQKFMKDKIQNLDLQTQFKMINPDKNLEDFNKNIENRQGKRYYQRLSAGLLPIQETKKNFKFSAPQQITSEKNKTMSIKKQNIFRNMQSTNILSAGIKISKQQDFYDKQKEIDNDYEEVPFYLSQKQKNFSLQPQLSLL